MVGNRVALSGPRRGSRCSDVMELHGRPVGGQVHPRQQYPAGVLDLDARLEFTLIRIAQITTLSQQNWLAPEPRQVRRFTGCDPIPPRGRDVDLGIAALFRLTGEGLIAEERYYRW